MYERLLGPAWQALPEVVRSTHRPGRAVGTMRVSWGRGVFARALAWLLRFPRPAAEALVELELRPSGEGCLWVREIGGTILASGQRAEGDLLVEAFGPLLCAFRLRAGAGEPWARDGVGEGSRGGPNDVREASRDGLREGARDGSRRGSREGSRDGSREVQCRELRYEQEFAAVRLLRWRVRLPVWMAPRVRARIVEVEGGARTEVELAMPLLGMILSYAGITEPVGEVGARAAS